MLRNKRYLFRFFQIAVAWCVIFTVFWISLMLVYIKSNGLDGQAFLFLTNNYYSKVHLVMIFVLPFVCSVDRVLMKDDIKQLIRHKTRGRIARNEIVKTVLVSILFSVIHNLINYIGLKIFFDESMFRAVNLLNYSIAESLVEFVYFLRVGCVFLVIKNLAKNKMAPIYTFLVYFIESEFSIDILNGVWFPCNDVTIFNDLLDKAISSEALLILLLRGLIFTITAIYVSIIVFEKRDYLNEKN